MNQPIKILYHHFDKYLKKFHILYKFLQFLQILKVLSPIFDTLAPSIKLSVMSIIVTELFFMD